LTNILRTAENPKAGHPAPGGRRQGGGGTGQMANRRTSGTVLAALAERLKMNARFAVPMTGKTK
jgi:hypothetical protein